MFKLIIKQKGRLKKEVELKDDASNSFSIGRSEDNFIVLPEQHGISRKHVQITREGNKWTAKKLSQSSPLIVNGKETDEAEFEAGETFQIQDYEFTLQEYKMEEEDADHDFKNNLPLAQKKPPEKEKWDQPPALSPVSRGKTTIMDVNKVTNHLVICLKIAVGEEGLRDIVRLKEGSEWIIGRDSTCDLMIESPNISRKHFKITKKDNEYYLCDLNSSNGTVLNDKELRSGKAYPIQSGDTIYIIDIEILFEVKNISLEKELAVLKVPPALPEQTHDPNAQLPVHHMPSQQMPLPIGTPNVIQEESGDSSSFFERNKKRIFLYGFVFLVIGVLFFLKSGEEKKSATDGGSARGELAGLSSQQQQIVKDTYQIAQQLYSKGKFEYCRSEVKKIHEYIDSYQQSKKLEIACAQAADYQRRQHDLEEKKRKATETQKLIEEVTEKCSKKFKKFRFKHELIACLNPAIELAPADQKIQVLTEQFDANELAKKEQRDQRLARQKNIRSIRGKYSHAQSLRKKGNTQKAMAAYQHFISISNHKELFNERQQARRELANMTKNFKDKITRLNTDCSNKFNSNQLQKAYYICKKASKQIPKPYNKKVIQMMNQAKHKIQIAMKPIYEEATINESVGNVSVAQEKWKEILSKDVKIGLYYKRARSKLDKY